MSSNRVAVPRPKKKNSSVTVTKVSRNRSITSKTNESRAKARSTSDQPMPKKNPTRIVKSSRVPLSRIVDKPIPARAIDPRIIVLLVAFAISAVIVYNPVITWFEQSHKRDNLITEVQVLQSKQDNMKEEIKNLNNPTYVQQQIRERLQKFIPGETPYMIEEIAIIEMKEKINEGSTPNGN